MYFTYDLYKNFVRKSYTPLDFYSMGAYHIFGTRKLRVLK